MSTSHLKVKIPTLATLTEHELASISAQKLDPIFSRNLFIFETIPSGFSGILVFSNCIKGCSFVCREDACLFKLVTLKL